MSFTNILECRIDISLEMHTKIFLSQPPHHSPLLINFWLKMRNEPNRRLKTDKYVHVIRNKKLFASM